MTVDKITMMVEEANSYSTLEKIEVLAKMNDGNLSVIPVQPFYMALRELNPSEISPYLSKMSKEQRQAFLDIDLWKKDDIDPASFSFWVETYFYCKDEKILDEFVSSVEFELYLKGVFNIWTFDVEDPMYPDHDYYFLTDDSLLLFEYDETFEYVEEAKQFIRQLYSKYGVENAYSRLFKLVSESYSHIQEEEYRLKKGRLRDYGFVDYFDALKIKNLFANLPVLENFIAKKKALVGEVDNISLSQSLNRHALVSFKGEKSSLGIELSLVKDDNRSRFLQFNFLRTINGVMALSDALKSGSVAMGKTSKSSKVSMELGLSFVKSKRSFTEDDCLLNYFDFEDLFRIGNSIIGLELKAMKKVLREFKMEECEEFIGKFWVNFLDESFLSPAKVYRPYFESDVIDSVDKYRMWKNLTDQFIGLVPFVAQMHDQYKKFLEDGMLKDEYYLNYNVSEIDFESIILSAFINYNLNESKEEKLQKKMGLFIQELKKFVSKHFKEDQLILSDHLEDSVSSFLRDFGMSEIKNSKSYLEYLLKEHLEGYDYPNLDDSEFKHVGGPILFQTN